ncbi:WD repeat-containing protein 26 [Cladobotryum mycophilum]|uniref:WD repeat-containing protein 26 n=1 Tax=Cladobotryum mycophilum TaxID=491253 RepID=A0ABR0SMA9_9HYPO
MRVPEEALLHHSLQNFSPSINIRPNRVRRSYSASNFSHLTAAARRREVDLDRFTNSRSQPVNASGDRTTPSSLRSFSATPFAPSSILSPPGPDESSARALVATAEIESSAAQAPPTPNQDPSQIIGRRRRRLSSDDLSQDELSAPVDSPRLVSGAANPTAGSRIKRRRRDDTNMLSDGDLGGSSIVPGTVRSNGSTTAAQREGDSSIATNGSRKAGFMMNGSSNGEKRSTAGAVQFPTYFGHNREEVTRILIQALTDMGYQTAADSVSQESGYDLENPTVAAFRSAVLAGSWAEAEQLLGGATTADGQGEEGNGLILSPGSDKNVMRFWIRQQKFLELLEQRDTSRALMTLRGELTPLYQDTAKLHFLSSLLMCRSTEDLMAKANWDGARGQSRKKLLSDLSRCISPSVMLPESRLAVLLQHVKQSQIDTCLYHTAASSPSLYSDHLCDRRHFPSEVALELSDLDGEVWQVQFSHDGTKLAASGSLNFVVIWDTTTFTVTATLPDHGKDAGVCNVAWSPDDSMIVTCSFDKHVRLWDAKTGSLLKMLKQFQEPVSACVWASDSRSFVLGCLDKNQGLSTHHVHDDLVIDWNKKHRVQELCGSPDERLLVAVDDLHTIHVYDAATRELEYHLELTSRPTSVSISLDSRHLLVNKQDGEAQLIDLTTRNAVQKFLGHTGGDYLIRSAFGGANESFVISGSEDGNILIWHKNIGAAVERLPGHLPRCNAVSWNPADPCMLASCGDDGRIKIWTNRARAIELRELSPPHSRLGKSVAPAGDRRLQLRQLIAETGQLYTVFYEKLLDTQEKLWDVMQMPEDPDLSPWLKLVTDQRMDWFTDKILADSVSHSVECCLLCRTARRFDTDFRLQ